MSPAKPGQRALHLDDVRGVVESLDSARDTLAGYAEVKSAEVTLDVSGVQVTAVLDNNDWMVTFG